jgi:methylenetetrahydrofolate reductase (NADPH)
MEKITDKIKALPQDGNFFSLEFFPPKTSAVCNNLHSG